MEVLPLVGLRLSAYNRATMRFEIILSPEAIEDLQGLRANDKAEVRDAIEQHLRHEPTKVSKSRIKRLRGTKRPQYRLRVGDDIRVFYDVTVNLVEVLAIVRKSEADHWLQQFGEPDERDPTV